MTRTMAWRFVGRLTLAVHVPENPSNLEWRTLLRDEAARAAPPVNGRTLIVSYGGGPDGPQRSLLGQQIKAKPQPTCIMTKSAVVRAITSALLFFNRNMKVVGLHDDDDAFAFLGLAPEERTTLQKARKELEEELGLAVQSATA